MIQHPAVWYEIASATHRRVARKSFLRNSDAVHATDPMLSVPIGIIRLSIGPVPETAISKERSPI
jgi:hypothetical protein